MLIIATIALAFGYQKLVCKEATARGAIASGAGLIVSALIPGPLILGLIPAIISSYYINKKMGKDFKPIEYSTQFYTLITSIEFRKHCEELFKQYSKEQLNKAA